MPESRWVGHFLVLCTAEKLFLGDWRLYAINHKQTVRKSYTLEVATYKIWRCLSLQPLWGCRLRLLQILYIALLPLRRLIRLQLSYFCSLTHSLNLCHTFHLNLALVYSTATLAYSSMPRVGNSATWANNIVWRRMQTSSLFRDVAII